MKFSAANENMAALKVSYVNLRDRVRPIVHQALDIKSDPRNVLSQLYGHQIRSPMVVDFEHDRRQVVVRFPYTEHQGFK